MVFYGEAGVDAGGLTTELFRLFFLQVAHDDTAEAVPQWPLTGCPNPMKVRTDWLFGREMDPSGCSEYGLLAPPLLKYLLEPDAVLTLRDLECFGPEYEYAFSCWSMLSNWKRSIRCGTHCGGASWRTEGARFAGAPSLAAPSLHTPPRRIRRSLLFSFLLNGTLQ